MSLTNWYGECRRGAIRTGRKRKPKGFLDLKGGLCSTEDPKTVQEFKQKELSSMLTEQQQCYETIKNADSILITFKQNAGGDAISASLAVAEALKQLGKSRVDIVADQFSLPKNYHFLPAADSIKPKLDNSEHFVIQLDLSKANVDELSYTVDKDKLNIIVRPEKGKFDSSDVSAEHRSFAYDLVIVLDTQDLESLGSIYDKHTEFFYKTPIINIDHNPGNEKFGAINMVDITAAATTEVLYPLLNTISSNIDENMATHLLTGIISKTKSFRATNMRPQTLSVVSQLIAQGAKREDIMHNLYRTRSIETLKLWGKVLARLKSNASHKIVWSVLSREDFLETGGTEEDIPEVIDELIVNTPEAEIVVLLWEGAKKDVICGLVSTQKNHDAIMLSKSFDEVQGSRNEARFCVPGGRVHEVERNVIQMMKETLHR